MSSKNLESAGITLLTAFAKDSIQDAGSFNGVSCNSAGLAVLSDRHYFLSFPSTVNNNPAAQFNLELPTYYQDGEDIVIDLTFTYLDGVGGVVAQTVGMTKNDTVFGDDAETEYQSVDAPAGVTTDWDVQKASFTFDGAGLVAGDSVAFVFFRDTRPASNDTLAATVYINSLQIKNI